MPASRSICRTQTIEGPDGGTISFEVDAFRKTCLLEGLDDIGLTMQKGAAIDTLRPIWPTSWRKPDGIFISLGDNAVKR